MHNRQVRYRGPEYEGRGGGGVGGASENNQGTQIHSLGLGNACLEGGERFCLGVPLCLSWLDCERCCSSSCHPASATLTV